VFDFALVQRLQLRVVLFAFKLVRVDEVLVYVVGFLEAEQFLVVLVEL